MSSSKATYISEDYFWLIYSSILHCMYVTKNVRESKMGNTEKLVTYGT